MGQFVIPAGAEQSPTPFDVYRQEREDGSEFWSARDLMGLMGYAQWVTFENPLKRAMKAAENQNLQVEANFYRSLKVGTAGKMKQTDYELSRFAAYLVAMNGDPNKPEVARAQAYFATKTRQAETAPMRELTGPELMARALVEADSTIKALEARVYVAEAEAEESRPKAEAYDTFLSIEGSYYMGNVAKMLGMGQNELFERLRGCRVLIPSGHMRNTPYAEYKRHFVVRPHRHVSAEGREFLKYTTLVRPSGVAFICRRLGIEPPRDGALLELG